jgi:acetyltransferase-like isoleucine patch superfamily enzyme
MVGRRDPREARFLTLASLRWVVRNRAWTPWYLIRYLRLARLKLSRRDIVLEGMVFLGKKVKFEVRKGYGRIVVGRFVHIGSGTKFRAHEGTMRIGDKCVFGTDNTINCYVDVEFGAGTLVADWVYVTDFDHVYADPHVPIKDQGLVKSPVRIGPGSWLGVKVTVLRGVRTGPNCVFAAHTVVKGDIPAASVVGGVPGRVVKDIAQAWELAAQQRADVADMARKQAAAVKQLKAADR